MKDAIMTTAFKRDLKKLRRQQKDLSQLGKIVDLLIDENPIPNELYDHPLKGKRRGCRELHIESDWLLIYHIENNTIYFDRTGSHAQLF